jgi:hypothetical protein
MMNSATSIKEIPAKPRAAAGPGFRPWHFFLLASLMAATAAVLMSRQSSPEHLILISLTIASAGVAAAGLYRMVAPLTADDASLSTEARSDRLRAALEREKALTLRSIKELEFDRAMGKVSSKDFDEMAGRLRARAMILMKQLDEGPSVYRAAIERELTARLGGWQRAEGSGGLAAETSTCARCGTHNDGDASYCKRCGSKLGDLNQVEAQ